MQRRLFFALTSSTLLVLAASAGVAVAQPPPSATVEPQSDPIKWSECGTIFKGECATIPMPVDWANPSGPKFPLAIGRLRALDPANRIGVLIAYPGGPGNSGINTFITARRIPDDSPLRKVFDIVSVDPRGVARSNPVICSAGLVDASPTTFPASESEYQALLEFNRKLAQDCRQRTGPLFDHVDTVSTVKDLDEVRKALGEHKISFFGASYGTQVGQQYAELFAGSIRAMTLDSNIDHSITSAFTYLRTTSEDLEGTYIEFAGWCGRTPACALHGRDAVAVWDKLHAKAEAGTLIDPDTGLSLGAEQLRSEMFNLSFRPKEHWFPLADRLAALADQNLPAADHVAENDETVENPYPAIWCSDWHWNVGSFGELDYYRRYIARYVAPHTKLSPFWSDVTQCLGWPGPVNNPQHRLVIQGAPTMLITKSRHDVGTPKSWTYAVADQIRNSVLLEYDGVGHRNFTISSCTRRHIETYLISLTTPPAGTHCPAEYPTQPTASPANHSNG